MNDPKHRVYASRVRCRDCPLLPRCIPAHLGGGELAAFERSIEQYSVVPGRVLVRRGDPFTTYVAVRQGLLKAMIPSVTGEERIGMFAYPGDIAGFGAQSGRWPGTLVAVVQSTVCHIPRSAIATLALKDRVIHLTAQRLHAIYDYHISITGGASRERRLARFLLDAARGLAATTPSRPRFQLRISQHDLGTHLGMTKESVNRAFAGLKQRGLIEHQAKSVYIPDPQALQAFIDDDQYG
ncbi:MAG TPA: helix-turn-helix domain-containing protein [Gammaproteobacteria bacterium]|nr:helix-turn-helix domain-containing protein [Gammaproteobacteria bacterium]